MKRILQFSFLLAMLAIIGWPAWFIYQHPEILATPLPLATLPIPTVATAVPDQPLVLLATGTPFCSARVHAARGGDGALNLRSGPGTGYSVLLVLIDGETVAVDPKPSIWRKSTVVRPGGIVFVGFVRSDYLVGC